MSAQVDTTNGTSFSELRTAYNNGNQDDADDDSGLQSEDDTSLSQFRTANFTDGTSIPAGTDPISIGTHFLNSGTGRTFGSGGGRR